MPANDQPATTYGKFYQHAQLDGQYFADTGKEKFDDVVMVEIFIKGSTKASISKRVYDDDGDPVTNQQGETFIDMYPKAYQSFMRDTGAEVDGTPIRNMGGAGPGQIMNLQAQGIESVEDLAGLEDNVVIGEPGMLDLRKKAQAYLAALHPEQAEAEKAEKEQEMETLRLEVQQMKDALANAVVVDSKRTRRKRNPETGQLE
jgi:hypothetical protein